MNQHPLLQLVFARLRTFFRHPEALFWTYGFPLMMLLGLGFAFREADPSAVRISVDVIGPRSAVIAEQLRTAPKFDVQTIQDESWRKRLQTGKTSAVVETFDDSDRWSIWQEPLRGESQIARYAVEAQLVREEVSEDLPEVEVHRLETTGSRYIDFLVPGMLTMNLMGGGLWGVGFVIVDARIRKLLKRFLATPMLRWHYLASVLIVRFLFAAAEILAILIFSYLTFGVRCQGTLWELAAACAISGASSACIGLLLASRVQTSEAVSGLMNFILLPMWLVGGIFFSNERFPEWMQPLLKALPYVSMVDMLRAIMLEGASLVSQWRPIVILALWGFASGSLALRIFRWR